MDDLQDVYLTELENDERVLVDEELRADMVADIVNEYAKRFPEAQGNLSMRWFPLRMSGDTLEEREQRLDTFSKDYMNVGIATVNLLDRDPCLNPARLCEAKEGDPELIIYFDSDAAIEDVDNVTAELQADRGSTQPHTSITLRSWPRSTNSRSNRPTPGRLAYSTSKTPSNGPADCNDYSLTVTMYPSPSSLAYQTVRKSAVAA